MEVSPSDEELANLAARGERPAFEVLVRRHKGALFAFVRRYVGQRDDAHDVLQNAFLAAWLALNRYDPSRPFLPWLRTIALNKCRDFGRRQKVRRLLLLAKAAEPEPESIPSPDINAHEAIEALRLRRLDAAITALPSFYKEPLLLTAVSGLSHVEAAALLKITPKAVEMRLRRARQRLAKAVGHDGAEG
jgi:RNA polymerase sigma-70 factor (ECF subfamily)